MSRTSRTYRFPDITLNQLADLEQWTGLNHTEIIRAAVDLMHQQEMKPMFGHKQIDGENVAVVEYPTGEMYTTSDWQGRQPQSPEEVQAHTWYQVDKNNPGDTDKWQGPAIIVDGLPRLLK